MAIRKPLIIPIALLAAVSSLSAFQSKPADLTGVWTGTMTRTGGQPGSAHLELTQKGADLTGTAGPAADRQTAIANGKVTTAKGVTSVTFDATQPNGLVMKFDLRVVDGRLKGKVTADADGKTLEAALDVGRTK
jgi:hypothetical protein